MCVSTDICVCLYVSSEFFITANVHACMCAVFVK
jgi:hypothetical protein